MTPSCSPEGQEVTLGGFSQLARSTKDKNHGSAVERGRSTESYNHGVE